jgi:hypothetical protein
MKIALHVAPSQTRVRGLAYREGAVMDSVEAPSSPKSTGSIFLAGPSEATVYASY